MTQTIEVEVEVLKEVEKITPEIEALKKVVESVVSSRRDIMNRIESLIEEWKNLWDYSLNCIRRECRFTAIADSGETTFIVVPLPSPIKLYVKNTSNLDEVKNSIIKEIIRTFHYQIAGTAEKLIEILSMTKELLEKQTGEKYAELDSKVSNLDAKVYQIRREIERLREKRDELEKEIEELREERAELIQEVENLRAERAEIQKHEEKQGDVEDGVA